MASCYWADTYEKTVTYGLRNDLLVVRIPTTSTSQILKEKKRFEPCTSNIYKRRVLVGEF